MLFSEAFSSASVASPFARYAWAEYARSFFERLFLFFGRLHGRELPLRPGRIGAVGEDDAVPELPVHELTGMIVDADDTPAFLN